MTRMYFWQTVKEVSAQTVREEARRLFVLALAGERDAVAEARARVLGPGGAAGGAWVENPFLHCASPPYSAEDEKRIRHADLLVSLPGGPGLTEFRPADTLPVVRPEDAVQAVLTYRPDLRLALARRLPGFRDQAAERLIRDVSRINAEFALISGITQGIPFLQPLFPAVVGADLLILTKNQILLVYRLAAIYDEDLDLRRRLREVVPVVGGALGFRSVARELIGLIPAVGLPVRAAIAYSGTYAVGRATQTVFDEGRRPNRREMRRIYEEGATLARGAVAALRERVTREKPLGDAASALLEANPGAEPVPDTGAEPTGLDADAAARTRSG